MDDFAKTKITIAIALLATAIAINPLIKLIGSLGFDFILIRPTISYTYYLSVSLLGVSVYLFSLKFVSREPIPILDTLGNYSYALALSFPLIFLLLESAVFC